MSPSVSKPRLTRHDFVTSWLRSAPDPKYTTFTCTLLSEVGGARPAIERALGEAVFVHHHDPDTYRKKLAHLGFSATAAS